MTNLQTTRQSPQRLPFTPEQALILLPAIGGVLLSGLVALAALQPLLGSVKVQEERLRTYQEHEAELPLLRRQQDTLQRRLKVAQGKQNRIAALVSNVDQLDTLLASFNRLAVTAGINLVSVEPEPKQEATAAKASKADAAATPKKEDDRFVLQYYLLELGGNFAGIQRFLHDLEALNTAVLVSDLSVSSDKAGGAGALTMKMRLAAYQKKADQSQDKPDTESLEESEGGQSMPESP